MLAKPLEMKVKGKLTSKAVPVVAPRNETFLDKSSILQAFHVLLWGGRVAIIGCETLATTLESGLESDNVLFVHVSLKIDNGLRQLELFGLLMCEDTRSTL